MERRYLRIYVFRCVLLYQIEKESEDTMTVTFKPTFAVFTCNQIVIVYIGFLLSIFYGYQNFLTLFANIARN